MVPLINAENCKFSLKAVFIPLLVTNLYIDCPKWKWQPLRVIFGKHDLKAFLNDNSKSHITIYKLSRQLQFEIFQTKYNIIEQDQVDICCLSRLLLVQMEIIIFFSKCRNILVKHPQVYYYDDQQLVVCLYHSFIKILIRFEASCGDRESRFK